MDIGTFAFKTWKFEYAFMFENPPENQRKMDVGSIWKFEFAFKFENPPENQT